MNLVEITEKKYNVSIELAYATNNNFTGKKYIIHLNVLYINVLNRI